jgi:hypothetical protein
MLSKLQAQIWFGSIAGRLSYRGIKQEWVNLGDGEWETLPSENAFIRLGFGDYEGKEIWYLEFRKYSPIRGSKVGPSLMRKVNAYGEVEWPDFVDYVELVQDADGLAVVRFSAPFFEKQSFKTFTETIGNLELVTHSIAQAFED